MTSHQVSANFHVIQDNLACPCCNAMVYDQETMTRIQILRDLIDKPFHLDRRGGGFFRCRDYQRSKHPEVRNSQHTLGKAMDISSQGWDGVTKHFFVEQAMQLGFSVGVYEYFFHIDFRSGNPVLFWG